MTQVESKQWWPAPNIDLILERAGQLQAALKWKLYVVETVL